MRELTAENVSEERLINRGCEMTLQCIAPDALEEGDLLAYLEGTAADSVRAHLAQCPHCRARLAEMRRAQALLRAVLWRHACPAPERLGLYQLRLLPAEEQLLLAQHVRACPHCQRELQALAAEETQPALLQRWRAALDVLPARLVPVAFATGDLRGVGAPLQRFRAGALDIHISVQPGYKRGQRTLLGQLFPPEGELAALVGQEVWLLQQNEAWAAVIETDGVFIFEGLEPGTYQLGLTWQAQLISIPNVSVL